MESDIPVTTRRQRLSRWCGRRPWLLFVLLFLLVGSASAGVGWVMRPRNPFDTPPTQKRGVPQQETAAKQFLMAVRARDDIDAWEAVREYFPDAVPERRRAEERLALLFLRNGRFEEAKELFKQFAFLGAEQADLRAKGKAGLAVVASLEGDHRESQRIVAVELVPAMELLPRPRQLDPVMESLVREAIARNQKHLGEQEKKDFAELFRRANADDSSPLVKE